MLPASPRPPRAAHRPAAARIPRRMPGCTCGHGSAPPTATCTGGRNAERRATHSFRSNRRDAAPFLRAVLTRGASSIVGWWRRTDPCSSSRSSRTRSASSPQRPHAARCAAASSPDSRPSSSRRSCRARGTILSPLRPRCAFGARTRSATRPPRLHPACSHPYRAGLRVLRGRRRARRPGRRADPPGVLIP